MRIASVLRNCIQNLTTQNKYARINAWKRKLRSSEACTYKWLKNGGQSDTYLVRMDDGTFTANEEQQLNSTLDALHGGLSSTSSQANVPKRRSFSSASADI